jgi:hypothetical protein
MAMKRLQVELDEKYIKMLKQHALDTNNTLKEVVHMMAIIFFEQVAKEKQKPNLDHRKINM